MANSQDMEILIHITAPSKVVDDVKYRSLAAAYIDFHPQKRQNLSEPRSPHQNISPVLPTTIQRLSSTSHHETFQQTLNSDRWLPSLRSPQASFDGVIDNADSPLYRAGQRLQAPQAQGSGTHSAAPQSSWETPPSFVQDSFPENDTTTALLTTPTRVLEHYLQNFATPSQLTQRRTLRSGPAQKSSTSTISTRPSAGVYQSRRETTIPCTPGNRSPPVFSSSELGKPSANHARSRSHPDVPHSNHPPSSDDDVIEDTVLYGPETPSAGRADSEPPPSKRARRDKSDASPGALLRTSSDVGPHREPVDSRRTITFLSSHDYGYNSLELNPPEPPVGCALLGTDDLITSGLERLAADLRIPKRYRPASTSRELRSFERGYWSIDCADWPRDLKDETWVFLANYIGAGVAGWGVSCTRDKQFSWLRLYCWGSLVGHIYLLIYLASRRRVGYSDTSWIDGDGEKVIVMGKKEGIWIKM